MQVRSGRIAVGERVSEVAARFAQATCVRLACLQVRKQPGGD